MVRVCRPAHLLFALAAVVPLVGVQPADAARLKLGPTECNPLAKGKATEQMELKV